MVPHPESVLGKFLKVVETGRRASVLAFMMEHFNMSRDLAMDAIVMDNQPLLNHTTFIPSSVQERLRAWVESLERPMQVAMTPEELVAHINNYIQTINKTKPVPGPFMLGLDMAVGEPTPELESGMDNASAIALQIPLRVYKWYDALPGEAKMLLSDLKQGPDGKIMTMGERITEAYYRRTGKSEYTLKRATEMLATAKKMIRESSPFTTGNTSDLVELHRKVCASRPEDYKLDEILQEDLGPGKLSFKRAKPTELGGDLFAGWITQLPPHMVEGSDERLGENRHQSRTDVLAEVNVEYWSKDGRVSMSNDHKTSHSVGNLVTYFEKSGLKDVVVLDDTVYLYGTVSSDEIKAKAVYVNPEGKHEQMTVHPHWPLGTKAPTDDPRIVRDKEGVIVGVKGPFSDAEVAEIFKRYDEIRAVERANDTLGNSTSNITSAFGYPKE
ncbi:MAG: hypothetical protein P4L77_11850 [Sulfuriferula sp.]|nr:hypothetical protein [Sulfuriferula sp.]